MDSFDDNFVISDSQIIHSDAKMFYGQHWDVFQDSARVVEMKRYPDGTRVSSSLCTKYLLEG